MSSSASPAGSTPSRPRRAAKARSRTSTSSCSTRDLRHLLEIERGQRVLLQNAYRQTVAALASAHSIEDLARAHSQRVQRYALELARSLSPDLVDDPSAGK